ncbi:MAG: hypothetical protein MJD61_07460, partial [Proteobacteria bacterium]|nr:hypothetical protein [Pseudomonadota bacterium]
LTPAGDIVTLVDPDAPDWAKVMAGISLALGPLPVGGLSRILAGATRGAKTARQMADDLAAQIGRHRVGGRTGSSRVDIDLKGKGHFDKATGQRIDTPHVHESRLHTGPNGRSSLGPKSTRPATKSDIRTARELARRLGLLD